jgi:hypothetical protein
MSRSRYTLPDPLCQHVERVRVSSHDDLVRAHQLGEEVVSTYCCDREACQDDAKDWVRAQTRRDAVHIVPLRRNSDRHSAVTR